jgi:hypothetical protein
MRDYRAYIFGVGGHRFVKVKDFVSDLPDDVAALSAARQLVDGHEVELWDCGRLVARLSASGEVASPELAPFTFPTASSQDENGSSKRVESVSPGGDSEMVGALASQNHLLLGW